jgi:hypothetical protein
MTTSTVVSPPAPPERVESRTPVIERLWGRAARAVPRDPVLVTVLAASFLIRWLLADRNSYWLDELYSVVDYGIANDSVTAAVNHLAEESIHPPLYQFALYEWMELFGDTERATRSLSNLYVTLATLFLYLLMRAAFTRRLALASAIVFALMYAPMYYGMETRSYAQTIFLVTLSSYALLRLMHSAAARGWEPALRSPAAVLFMVANVGLLLTHYYNAFAWVAQGLLVGVFALRERPVRAWPAGLGTVAGMYAIQGGIFALVWGRVFVASVGRRAGAYQTDGAVESPLQLLDSIAAMNLYHVVPNRVVQWGGLAVLVAMALWVVSALVRGRGSLAERQPAWTVGYLLGWLLLPLVVVYFAFLMTGVARYSDRYWLFIVPPLAPLLVLAAHHAVRLAGRAWRSLGSSAVAAAVAVAIMALLVLPGTVEAAGQRRTDHRGTAETIVDIVESDPESSYVVYDAAFRKTSVLDYYLSRFSDDLRVTATIQMHEERRRQYSFVRTADRIAASDFLIVAFAHRSIGNFPNSMERLTATYELQYQLINRRGLGVVVFSVPKPDEEPGA